MRDKLIELLENAHNERIVKCLGCFDDDECLGRGYCDDWIAEIADYLIAHGVTVETGGDLLPRESVINGVLMQMQASSSPVCMEEFLRNLDGVTVQTTPISYKRLLKLAKKMHTWIFLNTGDEQAVYDELGITEEENYVFGYGDRMEMPLPAAPKEVE